MSLFFIFLLLIINYSEIDSNIYSEIWEPESLYNYTKENFLKFKIYDS